MLERTEQLKKQYSLVSYIYEVLANCRLLQVFKVLVICSFIFSILPFAFSYSSWREKNSTEYGWKLQLIKYIYEGVYG